MVDWDQKTLYSEMTMDRAREAAMNYNFSTSLIKSKNKKDRLPRAKNPSSFTLDRVSMQIFSFSFIKS